MPKFSTESLPTPHFLDLHWIAGVWIGESETVVAEEHWSAAQGEVYMGMFRMLRDGRPAFYEFMTIAVEGEEVVLRIKHFYPGLKGWEAKDDSVIFVLVDLEIDKAVFYQRDLPDDKWMVYHRAGTTLTAHFETIEGEEPDSKFEFVKR